MKEQWKWGAAIALTGMASVLAVDARAGNVPSGAAEYYSVVLTPGDYLSYTGGQETHSLTVDDITYAAQIDPCDVESRCPVFSADDFALGDQSDSSLQVHKMFINGQEVTVGWSYSVVSVARLSIARGQYMAAHLTEENGTNNIRFDQFSHSFWAQLLSKSKRIYTVTSSNQDPLFPEYFSETMAATDAISTDSWAVPTSESRHYQSPHIVQSGGRVRFALEAAYAPYVDAKAFVKGRIFFSGAPTENVGVTVGTGP